MLGMSHADVSGMLVDKWQMPNELQGPDRLPPHAPGGQGRAGHGRASSITPTTSAISRAAVAWRTRPTRPSSEDVETILGLGITAEQLLEELEKHIQEAEPFFSLIDAN